MANFLRNRLETHSRFLPLTSGEPMSISLKNLDRVFGALLLIGSSLHSYGSISTYKLGTQELVWALSGSLAGGLTAVINLIRSGRPEDLPLAWLGAVACMAWFAVAIGYGAAIGNLFDPRVLWHATCALVLLVFSLRTALGHAS
jgi:hypothetical protein